MKLSQHMPSFRSNKPESGGLEPTKKEIKAAKKEKAEAKKQEKAATKERQQQAAQNLPAAGYKQRTLGGNIMDTILRRPPEPTFEMQNAPSSSRPVPTINVTAPTMHSNPQATFDSIPGLQVGPGKTKNGSDQATTLVPGTYVPPRGEQPPSIGTGIDQAMGDIPTPPPRRHADNAPRPANLGPAVTRNDIAGD